MSRIESKRAGKCFMHIIFYWNDEIIGYGCEGFTPAVWHGGRRQPRVLASGDKRKCWLGIVKTVKKRKKKNGKNKLNKRNI